MRWIPSQSTGVNGYRLYLGDVTAGSISATPIDLGRPATDASGIATATVTIDRSRPWAAELTAYGSAGEESPRSNRVTIPAVGETLGPSSYKTDFTSASVGAAPLGYVIANGGFAIAAFADGNHAAATTLVPGLLRARYVGNAASSWGAYELSGRMFLGPTADVAGVALRVPSSAMSEYFALGLGPSGAFTLGQAGKAPLTCAESASTGVTPARSRWYRFRVRYTNPAARARLRAKVWSASAAEPAAWQSDCWTTTTLALGSGVFALYRNGGGLVYWDDLDARPVLGALDPIP